MTKKKLRSEYRPYLKESLYCLIFDLVILAVCNVVLLAISKEVPSMWKIAVGITLVYFVAECFLNYKMAILIFFKHNSYQPIESLVKIKSMDIEWSASGHYDSMIGKLYPKEMDVHRLKFICVADNGKRMRLRCATTSKKDADLSGMLIEHQLDHVKVTYGPISKIIFRMVVFDHKGNTVDRVSFFDNRL